MSTETKTLNVPNKEVMSGLVLHAISNQWPFGGHWSKNGGWTLAVPADRYGEFLRLRETLKGV